MKQFEQVLLHHNPLFDYEDDDYNQHSANNQFSESTLEKNEDKYEPTVHAFSFEFNKENISKIQQYAENQLMSNQHLRNDLSKPIINHGKK